MIKGLVFDFDGLILDTETYEYRSLLWIYAQYDKQLSLDIWGKCIGTRHAFDPIEHLRKIADLDVAAAELRHRYKSHFQELISGQGARAGVTDYVQRARELGLRLAVASSSPQAWVRGYLTQLDLNELFDTICTADDVEHVKPDPALYVLATERLDFQPEQLIAFEDSPNGALAAKRAGLACVIVPNSVTETLEFDQYDLRLSSMAELDLDSVIQQISKAQPWKIS